MYGKTPLLISCRNANIEIIKLLLASGREINLPPKIDHCLISNKNEEIRIEIIELLESFENNPNETRTKLRIELGFAGNYFF